MRELKTTKPTLMERLLISSCGPLGMAIGHAKIWRRQAREAREREKEAAQERLEEWADKENAREE